MVEPDAFNAPAAKGVNVANDEDLMLRIDAGLLALLDHEVATIRRAQAAEAAATGADPKKITRTQVIRELISDGLRRRFEARGEAYPVFEPVGRVPRAVPEPEPASEEVVSPEPETEAAPLSSSAPSAHSPLSNAIPRRIGVRR